MFDDKKPDTMTAALLVGFQLMTISEEWLISRYVVTGLLY